MSATARKSPSEVEASLPWGLAWRLASGQIVAWGILYYAFTVVVGPMQTATGWPRTFLNSGLSLGLLAWGVFALPVGAWIQRRGGREVMAAASALGGCGLILMGSVPNRALYIVAWLMVGTAMAGMLYDSAFAVVTRAFGPAYRRGITLITLVGGLASTVFIPIAQLTVDQLGWQLALVALGGFQILFGVALHLFGVPRFETPVRHGSETGGRWSEWWAEFRRDAADPRFVGLALWFTAHAAAFTGLIFQLVPMLQAVHVDTATILQTVAVIGPMQVLGRFMLTTRGSHFSALRVGRWVMAMLFAATAILLVAPARTPWLTLFAALYGAGNGVSTILRGTAVAELYGRQRYAELNGALSAPAAIAKAFAPLGLAAVWSATGEPKMVVAGVLAFVLVGVIGLVVATRAQDKRLGTGAVAALEAG